MSAVATALSIVLAAVFLMAGVPKILRIAYFVSGSGTGGYRCRCCR